MASGGEEQDREMWRERFDVNAFSITYLHSSKPFKNPLKTKPFYTPSHTYSVTTHTLGHTLGCTFKVLTCG